MQGERREREKVYKIMSHRFLFGFFFFHAILYFCSEIKLWCSIIQAPCWGNVTESNVIFPFAPAPICTPQNVRSYTISCLPCCLISSSIMQCSIHLQAYNSYIQIVSWSVHCTSTSFLFFLLNQNNQRLRLGVSITLQIANIASVKENQNTLTYNTEYSTFVHADRLSSSDVA